MNRREAFQTITGLLAGGAAAGITIGAAQAVPKAADVPPSLPTERSQLGLGVWQCGRFTFRTFQDIFQYLDAPRPAYEGSGAFTMTISVDGVVWTNRLPSVECPRIRLWRTFFFPLRHRGDEQAVLRQLDFFLTETDVTREEQTVLRFFMRDVAEMRLPENPAQALMQEWMQKFGHTISQTSGLKSVGLDWKEEQRRMAEEQAYQQRVQEESKWDRMQVVSTPQPPNPIYEAWKEACDAACSGGDAKPDAGRG